MFSTKRPAGAALSDNARPAVEGRRTDLKAPGACLQSLVADAYPLRGMT
jgi:hypothetical protein